MASPVLKIETQWLWKEVPTDGSFCAECDEQIFLKQFQVRVVLAVSEREAEIACFQLCEGCKDALREAIE